MLPTTSKGRASSSSTSRVNSSTIPQYLRRIIKWQQMDIEYTFWQMLYLCTSPKVVYQHTKFHKQTKNQWARDDPAFVVISSLLLAVAALAYCAAYDHSAGHAVFVVISVLLFHFLITGAGLATCCWFLTNAYLREEAPNSHVVEQRLLVLESQFMLPHYTLFPVTPSSCPWFHTCIAVEPAVHGGSLPELDCIDLVRLITRLETLVELLEFHLVVFKTHHRIFSWSLDPRLWKLKCTNNADTKRPVDYIYSSMFLDEALTPCLLFFLVQSLDRNDTAADNLNQLSVTLPGENNIFPLSNRSCHCPISYLCLLFGKVNMIDPFSRCKLYSSSASPSV
ncbi:hypothetical protein NC653_003199 [Populus alba x Populus x berolinensis]|uniref:UNC-50 family protein n=1 Tax=Populus alba x Populus x berolinensis TaxID=444605 RepID=A0AAD6WHT8_9ROSI|nr:hypothetical protein NC653_003199 [Populus alba x Populus x berolinensis]